MKIKYWTGETKEYYPLYKKLIESVLDRFNLTPKEMELSICKTNNNVNIHLEIENEGFEFTISFDVDYITKEIKK